jgi:hypothetical protein
VSGNVDLAYIGWQPSGLPALGSKRITATTVASPGVPSLTLTITYKPGLLSFTSPTTESYTHWQYVPIQPITVSVAPVPDPDNPSVDAAIYYYVTGLPDGLSFTLNEGESNAVISGTPVTFSDAPQIVNVFASYYGQPSTYGDLQVLSKTLTMRTILPTVQKQQSSAGAWTSYLRQYTEVNAATTARDSRATPAIEYRLGEFTRPEPPSVVTAEDNCKC